MTNIIETLCSLHVDQFTGKVVVQKDQVTKTLFFRKGKPIFVDSTVRSETLGQMLLEQGRITEDQYRTVLEKMQETGKRQGEIIASLGFMSGFEVYEALTVQTNRKIQNCILLDDAEITAYEGDSHIQGISELIVDFFRCCLEAIDVDVDAVREHKDYALSLKLTAKGKAYLSTCSLLPFESKIVRGLDGRHNLEAILTEASGDDDEAFRFVHLLKLMKFIEMGQAPAKHFRVPASEVAGAQAAESPEPSGNRVVEIKEEPKNKPPSSPIYTYALHLDSQYHELFKLSAQANRFQVRKAYETIVRELHLDAIADHYIDKEKDVADQVFDRLTLALTVLSDDKRKHEYYQNIAKKKPPGAPDPAISAEVAIQKAHLLLGKKSFDSAEKEIRKAIELAPKESSYLVALAELFLQKALSSKSSIPDEVEKTLKEAIKLNSNEFAAFFQIGLLAKLRGDMETARNYFHKTVELKPTHAKAASELRLINMRAESQKTESPILKLFKKKPT